MRSERPGTIEQPINDSKGCGAVMRIAPVGLAVELDASGIGAFRMGCEIAALTHGHPTGYLAAGVLAAVIRAIVQDPSLDSALDNSLAELRSSPGHEETDSAVLRARELATNGPPGAERVESLGQGWVAEEALARGLYCALVAEDFAHGVRLAVNHAGDSDSTGATTGNILGALYGRKAVPEEWLAKLELREEIERLAHDLLDRGWGTFFPGRVERSSVTTRSGTTTQDPPVTSLSRAATAQIRPSRSELHCTDDARGPLRLPRDQAVHPPRRGDVP